MSSVNKNTAVILLSGGLDSLVALGYSINHNINIKLALTFDYGQKAVQKETEASSKICQFYNIEHKIIKLDWLKEITSTSLVSDKNIPKYSLHTAEGAKLVWVPNRNALFLNIAACFCDSYGYNYIIYGANKDEGTTFPDNTEAFRYKISDVFKTSTLVQAKVIAPLINHSKSDIVKVAVENSIPLELVWSCYESGSMHCGQCESCRYLKEALISNQYKKYLDMLFKNGN